MSCFWADKRIDLSDYVVETYLFLTDIDPKEAAEHLCQEHSTAQWKRVGINEDLRRLHGAKVMDLKVLSPSELKDFRLETPRAGKRFCLANIAHPHINFGPRLPNILTAVAGEGAFFSKGIDHIKLLDLEFPKGFLANFEGPKSGIAGLRRLMNIKDRPFFMGVVKPNIGLAPKAFAEIAGEAYMGGLDIAKDDEMLSDVAWSRLAERVRLCAEQARRAEDATGESKVFLANITDEVDQILRLHDTAVENGAGMVMINVLAAGLSATRMLCKHAQVPVVGHFDFIAPMSMVPYHGVSSQLITKLQRIAGCDAIIMPGFGARMKTPDSEVFANVSACTAALGNINGALPVPGGSDWAGTLPSMFEKLGSADFGFIPGRGVFGHPMGPMAGAKSLRQAWDLISSGIPLSDGLAEKKELSAAFKAFRE